MRSIHFDVVAWEQYVQWQQTDKAIAKRLNTLLLAVTRDPFEGIGKPEPLKHELAGCWSRRITDEHRLVYRVIGQEVQIIQVKFHYGQ